MNELFYLPSFLERNKTKKKKHRSAIMYNKIKNVINALLFGVTPRCIGTHDIL